MNTILLLGVGWAGEAVSDASYWLASAVAFAFTAAFVLLFRRTVGRSMGSRNRPHRPVKSGSKTEDTPFPV